HAACGNGRHYCATSACLLRGPQNHFRFDRLQCRTRARPFGVRLADQALGRDNRQEQAQNKGVTRMTDAEELALRTRLAELTEEHRDLDIAIMALGESGKPDQLQLTRLKKRKLQLKDEISRIENALLPDIIA